MSPTIGETTIDDKAGGGCPLEGMLSPLLWATLVDDLIRNLTMKRFYCLGYDTDDLAIVLRGRSPNILAEQIQTALNTAHRWCKRELLSVHVQKTQIVTFKY